MTKTSAPNFANVIRTRRRQLDLTQEEVARRVNTSVPYIGLLESGKRHPSDKVVTKLAEALGLDQRELFFMVNPAAKLLLAQSARPAGESPWDAFCQDKHIRQLHSITDKEMEILSQVALMGEVQSARDFLFILKTIRHVLDS